MKAKLPRRTGLITAAPSLQLKRWLAQLNDPAIPIPVEFTGFGREEIKFLLEKEVNQRHYKEAIKREEQRFKAEGARHTKGILLNWGLGLLSSCILLLFGAWLAQDKLVDWGVIDASSGMQSSGTPKNLPEPNLPNEKPAPPPSEKPEQLPGNGTLRPGYSD